MNVILSLGQLGCVTYSQTMTASIFIVLREKKKKWYYRTQRVVFLSHFYTESVCDLQPGCFYWTQQSRRIWQNPNCQLSPRAWEAFSAPALYLWARLGPALLIIHETLTGHNTSQHQTGSLSWPVIKYKIKKNKQIKIFIQFPAVEMASMGEKRR